MKQRNIGIVLALMIVFSNLTLAQDKSWQLYNGSLISFSYPSTWQLHVLVDRDVVVADTGSPISVEFAVSQSQPASNEQLALNAEKHVSQFAHMNNMAAKFEGWSQIEGGAVRVISHVCSDLTSTDLHFCPPNDLKAVDVSSIILGTKERIVLIEMMHKPQMSEAQINVGRQIVGTLKLKD